MLTGADRTARQQYAAGQWAALRDRLRTVTPQAVGRGILAAVAGVGALALTIASWPAFLPFVVGGLVTYELLPLVDALDRVMPRFLAAIVSVVVVVAVMVVLVVVGALVRALLRISCHGLE